MGCGVVDDGVASCGVCAEFSEESEGVGKTGGRTTGGLSVVECLGEEGLTQRRGGAELGKGERAIGALALQKAVGRLGCG